MNQQKSLGGIFIRIFIFEMNLFQLVFVQTNVVSKEEKAIQIT